ncbi:MAG: NUMOD4 motif-containing HNH endonuclease [Prevotella sp.]|nr:NUMOD4 motif-containing HNH endonuclease [Candidatus Prevotella equi]
MTEEWREITGYEGRYAVSNLGRVKTIPHRVSNHTGTILLKERILKPNVLAKGYFQVTISKGVKGTRKYFQVHRLVAMMFIPNPKGYDQVNHINGIKNDNRAENLEWCNNSMNQIHAYKHGLNHTGDLWRNRKGVSVAWVDDAGNIIKIYRNAIHAERELTPNAKNSSNTINAAKRKGTYKGRKFIIV